MDYIFNCIKKMLGIGDEDDSFDNEILVLINSAVSSLRQLGVGPQDGIDVDSTTDWEDLLGDKMNLLPSAREYLYIKVKMIFDTPSGPATKAFEDRLNEVEWRMCSELDRLAGV